ncbi:MAG: rhodanese-like domain-containing protein [Bacteroidales bacterium]|nr:rhodanese-like domain-containing protein [Bacteroidales bacterium]
MKILNLFLLAVVFSLASCKPSAEPKTDTKVAEVKPKTEVDLLLDYLAETGDYVNSRKFPSMIKPETVFEGLDSSMYIIDLRSPEQFKKGHIKGAANVQFSDIPSWFENQIKPYEYDKIVLVCDHGQKSSYTTQLLRLMGYGNVYSMRWGMAAWNKDCAGDRPWSALTGSEYSSKLETKENPAAAEGDFPVLNTGKTTGEEIFKERIKEIFAKGFSGIMLSAEDVFAHPDSFYVINYDRKDKYDFGHVPGAIRYKPGGTLGIASEMRTIPADKDVLVYCATGHNSAFVAAFLNLCGYKAHSMKYGCNSFMHDKMMEEKTRLSWEAFTEDMVMGYPYVK